MTTEAATELHKLKIACSRYRKKNSSKRAHYPKELRKLVASPSLFGIPDRVLCRVGKFSTGSLYNWRREFSGSQPLLRPKQLELVPVTEGQERNVGSVFPPTFSKHVRLIFRSGVTMELPLEALSSDLIWRLNSKEESL